jgi:DNA-binding transcriptional LysR family regulator
MNNPRIIERNNKRQFDDLMLGSIELFCLAAELESFTDAATAAGVTPAAVSRSVSRLEERMEVRLFVRTTRRIRLTDAGRTYYERCREALGQLVDAEREATGQQSAAAGVLRISMPTPYAHYRVLPILPARRIDRRPSRSARRVLRHRFAVDCLRRARSGSAQSADASMMRQASANRALIAPS